MAALSRRALLSFAAVAPHLRAQLSSYQARSTVSLVSGEDRRKNVYNALIAIDDQIRPALKRKKYVLLKPNTVAVKNQLGSTHVDALRGILDYLSERYRGPVVIADSSKDCTWDAYENFLYNRVLTEYRPSRSASSTSTRTLAPSSTKSSIATSTSPRSALPRASSTPTLSSSAAQFSRRTTMSLPPSPSKISSWPRPCTTRAPNPPSGMTNPAIIRVSARFR